MPPNCEVEQFLQRVSALPDTAGLSLDDVLKPSLEIEAELRTLFASDKFSERLADPHVGLVDVFDAPDTIRATRARVVKDEQDLSARYIMPVRNADRRAEGAPCIVSEAAEFKKNWDVFTEGSLSQLPDWNNVVAAGGAVLACLTPLPEGAKGSRRTMRKHYHDAAYPTSDVDLFLWGLSLEETEAKIKQIYEAVREAIPWDVTCVRTKNTVSIHSQFPFRTIQIILRQYTSPAEILVGFDIDAGCCLYDGSRVYANPRAIVAMMRQCNTIDETRCSSSYEIRLSKYAARGFEVYYPSLKRDDVDPTIYERALTRIEGLARLLVLEKLADTDARYTFLESRRTLRGRPNPLRRYNRRKRRLRGDLKGELSLVEMGVSEYDVVSLHIPYGPGWNARRIEKLVYQTDLSMNSTFNPRNNGRRLHRHPAFFGTVEECMEDCCGNCPAPIDEDERKAQEEEDQHYIRGRISFIPQAHGRKYLPGSAKPAEADKWSAQAYVGPTEKLFSAIAAGDRAGVARLLDGADIDIDRRDHVGRTPLHMAILSEAVDIACDLVRAGARITAQMVDGRTSLHLAAQMDQVEVVRAVLERSARNEREAKTKVGGEEGSDAGEPAAAQESESDSSRPSSEDDWSSEDDEGKAIPQKKAVEKPKPLEPVKLVNDGDLPEDEDVPDVFDVNGVDWDLNFTPLCHAVLFSSPAIVELLLQAGADATFVSLTDDWLAVLPLALAILAEDEDRACAIAEQLIKARASSAAADLRGTIFHRAVAANKLKLVATLLRCDSNARSALNFPTLTGQGAVSPLITAVHNRNYGMLAVLLAHGAKVVMTGEDVARATAASLPDPHRYYSPPGSKTVQYPVETALALQDGAARLLISLGADVSFTVGPRDLSFGMPAAPKTWQLSEWIEAAVEWLSRNIIEDRPAAPAEANEQGQAEAEAPPSGGWSAYLAALLATRHHHNTWWQSSDPNSEWWREQEKRRAGELKEYLTSVNRMLPIRAQAEEKKPSSSSNAAFESDRGFPFNARDLSDGQLESTRYYRLVASRSVYEVFRTSDYSPGHLNALYDELFEACFAGANEKIQQMFIPGAATASATETSLFYVSVQLANPQYSYDRTGVTPLVAAIAGRHWDTARLIMTIAGLQYKAVEKPARFSTFDIRLDASDHEHDGSEITVDEAAIKFVDIAKTGGTAQCDVPPNALLSAPLTWANDEPRTIKGSPLVKAVHDNDFEAFVNIANLYKYSSPHADLDSDPALLKAILAKDRLEMLDEYIRRTGRGIAVALAEDAPVVNDESRIYAGLSVHGKKRMDLAKQNDPNAFHQVVEEHGDPLLWQAAGAGACEIVEYLAGERPLAAYRFYAASNSDRQARGVRQIPDLDKALPELLGWTVTPLGESPLFAAVGSKSLPLVKKLFAKFPRLMASALHERVKSLGMNALMFAIYLGCPIELVDFLLAKSISPVVLDERNGWNIFHYLCNEDHEEMLRHMLHKLPRDVVEVLLCQQSKDRLETPLHCAVEKGLLHTVRALLAFSAASLRLRNIDGSTALHAAIQHGFPAITALLIAAAPGALAVENGVGHTPREMAVFQELVWRTHRYKSEGVEKDLPPLLPAPDKYWAERIKRAPNSVAVDVPALKETLACLVRETTLEKDGKLGTALFAFVDSMEIRPADIADSMETQPEEAPALWWLRTDTKDRAQTLATVRASVAPQRELVRLAEVQASVEASLARACPVITRGGEGLEPAGDGQQQGLHSSLVYRRMRLEKNREPYFGPRSEMSF
ncbi:ankyrin repeat protein [Mycena latifolia]|nr:ankyrin repeat protein [Mycena latifolia]